VPVHGGLAAVEKGGAWLVDAVGPRSSPRKRQTEEGTPGILIDCADKLKNFGRRGRDGPVTWRNNWAVVVLVDKCSGARRNEGKCREWLRGKWSWSWAPFIVPGGEETTGRKGGQRSTKWRVNTFSF
jgi:hypothetical protein